MGICLENWRLMVEYLRLMRFTRWPMVTSPKEKGGLGTAVLGILLCYVNSCGGFTTKTTLFGRALFWQNTSNYAWVTFR